MADDFDKIRRNVAKMLAQNAPEADIDDYLKSEKLTADEFKSVATGKMKLGDVRMTQKSEFEIGKELSKGQTIPAEGIERGILWPVSWNERDPAERYFDPDAGIMGMFKRGAMAPGDVASGKLDPNTMEGARRSAEMAMMFTPVGPAAKAAEKTLPGMLKSLRLGEPKIPTAQELKSAGSAGFDAARNLGVDYSSEAVKSFGDDLIRSLESDGFFAELAPKTHSLLARLREPPEGSVSTLDNLVTLRQTLQKAAGDKLNKQEAAAASRAIEALDTFVADAGLDVGRARFSDGVRVADAPPSVVAGPAAAAGPLLSDARSNYAAAMRSERVTDAITKAERNAAKAGSGQNTDNALRQRLESLLSKDARGFSQEERALLAEIVAGKHGANLARFVGNYMGGGGGLTASMVTSAGAGLGYLAGGPAGAMVGAAIPPALGVSARAAAGKITQGQARKLDELLRMRSPLYEKAKKNPPVLEGVSPEARAVLLRLFGLPTAEQLAQ